MSMTMPTNAPTVPQRSNSSTTYPGRQFFTPPSTLPGYYIESEKDIVAQYIPMDGSISFFPYKDLSKIVIKQWDANGLNTLEYVIAPPPPMNNAQNSQDAQQSQANPTAAAVQPAIQTSDTKAIVETLQNLNLAMANTFNQFGATLQGMQNEISALAGEIGGRG